MQIPDKLGRYEVRRRIGSGGMALVYEADDPVIGRRVAIKVLRSDLAVDPEKLDELKARFQREFRSAGLLSHPGIVTIHDVGREGGIPYIAMEYVGGGGLDELIKEEAPLPPERAASLVNEAAAALDYAHEKGIVHRDVKPANILLDPAGRVKIMDFGIAKLEDMSMTRTGVAVGTPAYMSPEQITGGDVSGRSDQFALANIAYELLTGARPFTGDSATSIMYQIVHATPPTVTERNSQLPARLDGVLRAAMAKNPKARYSTCSEFARDLQLAVREVMAARRDSSSEATVVLSGPVSHSDEDDADSGESTADRDADQDAPEPATPDREGAEPDDDTTTVLAGSPAEPTDSATDVGGRRQAARKVMTEEVAKEEAAVGSPRRAPAGGVAGRVAAVRASLEKVPYAGRIGAAVAGVAAVFLVVVMLVGGEEAEVGGDPVSSVSAGESASDPSAGVAADEPGSDLQEAIAYRVVSDPPGARIRVDGDVEGARTPTRVELAVRDTHRLILELPGYEPYEYRIDEQEPYEGSPRVETIHVALRPVERELADAPPARPSESSEGDSSGSDVASTGTAESEAGAESDEVEAPPADSEPPAEEGEPRVIDLAAEDVESQAGEADEESTAAGPDAMEGSEETGAAAGAEEDRADEAMPPESEETSADEADPDDADGAPAPDSGDDAAAASEEVVPLTPDVEPPRLVSDSIALELNADGLRAMRDESRTLTLRALVNTDGTVAEARFYRISPDFAPPGKSPQEFADIVERSVVTHWRFHPAVKDGRPVRVWYMVNVTISR